MCGCAYLNGWVAILGVQLLALIGMLFSIAAMGDCSFMELEERLFFPPDLDENLPLKVTQTQYVGFLTWKMLDGSCYFYVDGSDPAGQISEFFDILGRDFEMARIVAMLSACLSFVFFCYLLSFTCSSQTRGVRYFNTVFLSVILTGLQGVTFVSFNSSFCDEYGCTFSRSASFSVVSMMFFFLSGLCFCCTTDYPGPRVSSKMPKLMTRAQVAPDQSRGFQQKASLQSSDKQEEASNMNTEEFVMPDYEEEEVIDDQGDDMIEEEIVEDEDDSDYDDDSGSGSGSDDDYDSMEGVNPADEDDETTLLTDESQTATRTTEAETLEEVAEENRSAV